MQISLSKDLINRRTHDGQWMQGCEHTTSLLNSTVRNKVIFNTIDILRKLNFDTIACCGTSGLLVVPQISEILKKNIIVIRKKNEKRYSPFDYEGVVPKNYVIVDDLICSGDTVKHIIKLIKLECPKAKCIGVYTFFKDKCAYRKDKSLCKKDLGIDYL